MSTDALPGDKSPSNKPWWGQVELEPGDIQHWRIGQSELWCERHSHEWKLYHKQCPDGSCDPLTIPPDATLRRYSVAKTGRSLTLMPRLADRAMIVKPVEALLIPGGESIKLFAASPIWITVRADKPLGEFPSYRPSDTWFGPNTLEGELCYASRALGRLELSTLELEPHRAATPIIIQNNVDELLTLERLRVPVQYLNLYRGDNATLWTQSITLERRESGDFAELRIGKTAPREAGRSERLAAARFHADQNLVVRAFSKLFRGE